VRVLRDPLCARVLVQTTAIAADKPGVNIIWVEEPGTNLIRAGVLGMLLTPFLTLGALKLCQYCHVRISSLLALFACHRVTSRLAAHRGALQRNLH
jgi:hypothetical protein